MYCIICVCVCYFASQFGFYGMMHNCVENLVNAKLFVIISICVMYQIIIYGKCSLSLCRDVSYEKYLESTSGSQITRGYYARGR